MVGSPPKKVCLRSVATNMRSSALKCASSGKRMVLSLSAKESIPCESLFRNFVSAMYSPIDEFAFACTEFAFACRAGDAACPTGT